MMRQYELVERVQRYKPDVNEALLNKAYVYAMQKHGHQKRASGDPYFSHPLEVAAILTEMHLDESTIAVALLHDTIEDTSATRQEIDQLFGPDMGGLVEGLTARFGRHFESGLIRPVIDSVFPIEEAGAAHQRMADDLNIGKIVLKVRE